MTTPEGAPQEAPPTSGQSGGNGIAIAGLVIAIISLVAALVPFAGLGLAILALILSIMGAKKAPTVGGAGKGAAVAGIVIAVLGILLGGATTACGILCSKVASDAAGIQQGLEDAAQAAGYSTYEEWQQADPEAASAAAAEAGKAMMQGFGFDTSELEAEMKKAMEEAQREAAEEGGGE